MDPIAGGAVKNLQGSMFQEAQQQLQKADQQVSDFEKLRTKLEEQDAIGGGPDQMQQLQETNQTQQVDQVNQTNNIDQMQPLPEVKTMDQIEGMVNNIREGQTKLNNIISDAMSGKTYSPQEMLAMQAEVQRITLELETTMKVVESATSTIQKTFNISL